MSPVLILSFFLFLFVSFWFYFFVFVFVFVGCEDGARGGGGARVGGRTKKNNFIVI